MQSSTRSISLAILTGFSSIISSSSDLLACQSSGILGLLPLFRSVLTRIYPGVASLSGNGRLSTTFAAAKTSPMHTFKCAPRSGLRAMSALCVPPARMDDGLKAALMHILRHLTVWRPFSSYDSASRTFQCYANMRTG
jgi:hypothetical protein